MRQGRHGKADGMKTWAGRLFRSMSDADLTAAITNGKGKMPLTKGS